MASPWFLGWCKTDSVHPAGFWETSGWRKIKARQPLPKPSLSPAWSLLGILTFRVLGKSLLRLRLRIFSTSFLPVAVLAMRLGREEKKSGVFARGTPEMCVFCFLFFPKIRCFLVQTKTNNFLDRSSGVFLFVAIHFTIQKPANSD